MKRVPLCFSLRSDAKERRIRAEWLRMSGPHPRQHLIDITKQPKPDAGPFDYSITITINVNNDCRALLWINRAYMDNVPLIARLNNRRTRGKWRISKYRVYLHKPGVVALTLQPLCA